MARLINAAEAYETVYTAFATVNFSAYDYNTVKQSLLAYIQLYYPEDFNDYIESSEFIAQLELFAYIAELMAYRSDLNAHENFLSTAERKESVLRLANFISYTPTRNLPARGLVKITSVTTTQNVFDSLGRNLANVKIVWNDTSNANWQEQFFLVMNNVLTQTFGSVLPSNRVQVGDVLLELYTWNNSPLSSPGGGPVFAYTATAQGQSYPMELVSSTLTSNGPIEQRPENNQLFSIMYANDGLGNSSPTTGFLIYTKQGTLQSTTTTFDGVTPNQTFDITVNNINDTDVWVNNIDPDTGDTITTNPLPSSYTNLLPGYTTPYGFWYPVDTSGSQNIIFNTDVNRHKYEVETDNNDQITLIFGDGEMVDIPQGTFQIWYRVSANDGGIIPATSVTNQTASFNYVDFTNTAQTLTFTFSLTSSLLNSSVSETIDHIRNTAPSVYETQDRMVNAQDYNTYLLQDPSILKLTAFNRTFVGDSEYSYWYDPSQSYANVKIFGDDLALYFQDQLPPVGKLITVGTNVSSETLVLNYIQPLLSSTDFFTTLSPIYNALGGNPATLRTAFTSTELTAILSVLNNSANQTIYFYYSVSEDSWVVNTGAGGNPSLPNSSYIYMILVNKTFNGSTQIGWTINYASTILVAQSITTQFWNTNNGQSTINYDTLNSNQDSIIILSANVDAQGSILGKNLNYNVLSQVVNPLTPGLPNLSELSVLPTDQNGDGIPDNMAQSEIFNFTQTFTLSSLASPVPTANTPYVAPYLLSSLPIPSNPINDMPNSGRFMITLPRSYVVGYSNVDLKVTIVPQGYTGLPIVVTNDDLQPFYFNEYIIPGNNDIVSYQIQIGGILSNATFTGSISGTTLNISSLVSGTIYPGALLIGSGIAAGTTVVSGSGTSWVVSISQTVPSVSMTATRSIQSGDVVSIVMIDYVYLYRTTLSDPYNPVLTSDSIKTLWAANASTSPQMQTYIRYPGRYPFNFAWFHQAQDFHLIDPASTNIIDMYIITTGYYNALLQWLNGQTDVKPTPPTSLDLRTSYSTLLQAAMISDTVVLHSGNFTLLFGPSADPTLQATFAVVRPTTNVTLTDNQVQAEIVSIIQDFFDPQYWQFGETFFFTELAAVIQNKLASEIDSIVIVPSYAANQFGDLFEINPGENQLFLPDVSTDQISIVTALTPQVLRQAGY